MPIRLLVASLALAGCSASRPAEPARLPTTYCALDRGSVRALDGEYEASTGITYSMDGRIVGVTGAEASLPLRRTQFAADQPWYIDNAPVQFGGETYRKYGLPRLVLPGDLGRLGEAMGVPVFGESGETGTPDVVYLPVRSPCTVQPYQRD